MAMIFFENNLKFFKKVSLVIWLNVLVTNSNDSK